MLYPIQNSVRNKLDLSGIWDFKTDLDHIGEAGGWANGLSDARSMAVPGSWNEQYEDLFGYLDLAWYVKGNELKPSRVPSGNMPRGSAMDMAASTPRTTYDFYPFCGLHRPVVLYSVPQTYIEDIKVVYFDPSVDILYNVSLNFTTHLHGTTMVKCYINAYHRNPRRPSRSSTRSEET